MIEVPVIECVAGGGIRGDRYFNFKDDYKGQIRFSRSTFSMSFALRWAYMIARRLQRGAT